jgi:hypothetical protein
MVVMVAVLVIMVVIVVAVIMVFIMAMMVVAVVMVFIMVVMVVAVVMVFIMVVMVVAVYVQALFLLAVYSHLQMGPPNAAFFHGFRRINDSRNSKHIQFLQHFFRFRVKFQKGSRKHIACRAHIAFEI